MSDLFACCYRAPIEQSRRKPKWLYLAALAEQLDLRRCALQFVQMIYGQQTGWSRPLRKVLTAIEFKPDFGEAWFMLCESPISSVSLN